MSLDYAEKQIKILNKIRLKYFWTNKFLIPKEKQKFDKEVKVFTYLIIPTWIMAFILITLICATPFTFPKLIFNDEWGFMVKIPVKIIFFFNITYGFYISNVILSFCVYIILQSYFQMAVLRAYIKQMITDFGEDGQKSQWEIRLIFRTTIRQFQILNRLID